MDTIAPLLTESIRLDSSRPPTIAPHQGLESQRQRSEGKEFLCPFREFNFIVSFWAQEMFTMSLRFNGIGKTHHPPTLSSLQELLLYPFVSTDHQHSIYETVYLFPHFYRRREGIYLNGISSVNFADWRGEPDHRSVLIRHPSSCIWSMDYYSVQWQSEFNHLKAEMECNYWFEYFIILRRRNMQWNSGRRRWMNDGEKWERRRRGDAAAFPPESSRWWWWW